MALPLRGGDKYYWPHGPGTHALCTREIRESYLGKRFTVLAAGGAASHHSTLFIVYAPLTPQVSTCILGATSLAQLHENFGALDVVAKLTPAVLARIDTAVGERAVPALTKIDAQLMSTRAVADVAGLNTGRGRGPA